MSKHLKLTKQDMANIASAYSSKNEWRKADRKTYDYAYNRGWLKDVTIHMKVLWEKKWNKKSILTEAKKYKNKHKWRISSPASYSAAQKLGIMEEIVESIPHMSNLKTFYNKKWTKKAILKESRKYSSKIEWIKNNKSSYLAAKKQGIYEIATSHMKPMIRRGWTEEEIWNEASQCRSRTEWYKKYPASYGWCSKRGFLDKFCDHMKKSGGKSSPELYIQQFISQYYSEASSRWFSNKNKQKWPFSKLQIDIFIPELNKGIEFDGDYWHGKMFKRTWVKTPEEYHEIKDMFFKHEYGIEILHIKESAWKNDQKACLSLIKQFLNIKT